jgi:hypothetical protein
LANQPTLDVVTVTAICSTEFLHAGFPHLKKKEKDVPNKRKRNIPERESGGCEQSTWHDQHWQR